MLPGTGLRTKKHLSKNELLTSLGIGLSALVMIALASLVTGCAGSRTVPSDRKGILDQPQANQERKAPDPAYQLTSKMRWPLTEVEVTSHFGQRATEFHEGVDLKAASGTKVRASDAGRVLYAGSKIRGYGKLVIIKHNDDLSTVYAHNSKIVVKKGQVVRQGQWIANSGNTGHSTGPHLHFELRSGVNPIDPELAIHLPATLDQDRTNRKMAKEPVFPIPHKGNHVARQVATVSTNSRPAHHRAPYTAHPRARSNKSVRLAKLTKVKSKKKRAHQSAIVKR